MKTVSQRQLKCVIFEPAGIIAAELEDELRLAFDAKIFLLSDEMVFHENTEENFDIAILDSPTSMTAFMNLIDRLRSRTRAFVITQTHAMPFESALGNIVYRQLPKPYSMTSVVSLVSELIDRVDIERVDIERCDMGSIG